jgi:hypothetical protein
MRNWHAALVLPLVIALGLLATYWHFARAKAMLQRWTQQNGFHVVDRHYCFLFKGPFFWTTSRGQVVYRVTVEDSAGKRRSGWVRCGSWFFGVLSDRVEVRWDDAADRPSATDV